MNEHDKFVAQRALRYLWLIDLQRSLTRTHNQGAMLSEQLTEIQNIPQELKMTPEQVLKLAQGSDNHPDGC